MFVVAIPGAGVYSLWDLALVQNHKLLKCYSYSLSDFCIVALALYHLYAIMLHSHQWFRPSWMEQTYRESSPTKHPNPDPLPFVAGGSADLPPELDSSWFQHSARCWLMMQIWAVHRLRLQNGLPLQPVPRERTLQCLIIAGCPAWIIGDRMWPSDCDVFVGDQPVAMIDCYDYRSTWWCLLVIHPVDKQD